MTFYKVNISPLRCFFTRANETIAAEESDREPVAGGHRRNLDLHQAEAARRVVVENQDADVGRAVAVVAVVVDLDLPDLVGNTGFAGDSFRAETVGFGPLFRFRS